MRDIVRRSFVAYSAPLEGVVSWMYADVKGLVTTAIGNLIDPVSYALPLPWVRRDGTPASSAEVVADWQRVKGDASMARLGHRAAERVTQLRLTPAGVEEVVLRKLDEVDAQLSQRWQEYPTWCADAQLGVLSMAWAMGAAFQFPKFDAAVRRALWLVAAQECTISERGNPGVAPRNVLQRRLFGAAHRVQQGGLDPEQLWGWLPPDAPTVTEVTAGDVAAASLGSRRAMMGDALLRRDDE